MRLAIVVALCFLCAGCGTETVDLRPEQSNPALFRDAVAAVNLEFGISYEEALAITKYYLARYVRTPATISRLAESGRNWQAQLAVGPSGLASGWIVIDKTTGRVSSSGLGPTFENLKKMLAQ
jgi:hypothetical protein